VNGSDPQGLCPSTTIRGNWWVVNSGTDTVVEYAHGGTSPIATLTVSAGDAVSCAVDPTTGNLAVAIIDANEVVIFKNGSGSGSVIQDPTSSSFFIAYDNKGNLFVDGLNTSSVMLFELRKGANTFKTVTLPHSLAAEFPSELYWDGTYMDMEAQSYGAIAAPQSGAFGSTIYRLAIKHDKAVVEGTVQVTGGGGSFWVGESRLVAFAGNGLNEIGIWKYPAGGTSIKTFPIPNADEPLGLTVSLKPR
jgi:hypothetical protein